MGIGHFSDFVRRYAPRCYYERELEHFRGRRFAVDMNNLAYQMMSVATKDILDETNLVEDRPDTQAINNKAMDKIVRRFVVFVEHGITPVAVFDGKSHPLKAHAKSKKKPYQDKLRAKLQSIEEHLYSLQPLYRTRDIIDEYTKYYRQCIDVSCDFLESLKGVLSSLGFPVLSATDFGLETGDAEGICATLCMQGNDYCYAAVTNDSDYHVYGGNIQIIDVYPNKGKYYAKIRTLESILKQTKLSFERFRDLCILCGTDFNPNIPSIGLVRAWDKIQKYGTIREMAKHEDVRILNYDAVLKIFASTIVKVDIPAPEINIEAFRENSRQVLEEYHLSDHATTLGAHLLKTEYTETLESLLSVS